MLVHSRGPLIPESFNCFPAVTTEFAIEQIAPCVPGDVTRDGVVNVGDLVAVILAWSSDDHWADVDGSGLVDVADLVAVILGWSS